MSDADKQMALTQTGGSELRIIENSPESVMVMLNNALAGGTNVADLKELFALHERVTAQQARRDFGVAMAAFKSECPPVQKRTDNAQFKVTRDGRTRASRYASLADIEATIRGPLGKHGLSFRWDGATDDGKALSMTCIVSHVGGHSERSPVSMPLESKAGSSPQQKYASIMTYAQRYSLIMALGLTTCEDDVDGNEGGSGDAISDDQAITINALMDEVKGNVKAFLNVYGIDRVEDLPVALFRPAIRMLEGKRKS